MDLVRALWTRPGYGECRFIRDGVIERRWFSLPLIDSFRDLILEWSDAGWDAYFGVLPRTANGKGKAEDVEPWTDVLWADIDIKSVGSRMQAFLNLTKATIPEPHFVVDSGNGFHAYWKVIRADWEDAEQAMRGIAKHVQGDHVYDRARILRIPGTINWKKPTPKAVRILRFDEVRRPYNVEDFHYTEPEEIKFKNSGWKPDAILHNEGLMPGWLITLIEEGAPQGERSEAAYKVVCNLLENGWSDGAIEDVFINNPAGIGAKYFEKGADGPRWLDRTIKNAKKAV